jgi:hypothetical protein
LAADNKKAKYPLPIQPVNLWCIGLWLIAIFGFVLWRHTWLPDAKAIDIPAQHFSEARSRVFLTELQSIEGFRTVGSHANEKATPDWLLRHLKTFQAQCQNKPPCHMEIEVRTIYVPKRI